MAIFNFVSRFLGLSDPVIVYPYDGYMNNERVFAQARVLEDERITHSEDDSVFKNIYNSYKRFESDERKNAQVKLSWGRHETELISDKEGYIYLDSEHSQPDNHHETLWVPMMYELIVDGEVEYSVTSPVMKPSPKAEFGVISDLDDTVIHTGVSSKFKWRMIVNSIMKHSDKRLPLEGAAELYQSLHRGRQGQCENPFFYLSNSPWNIHDYLTSFLKFQGFPKGPILLRDVGIENEKPLSFKDENKYLRITEIFTAFPKMKFILIGDAADIDPEIYSEIAINFPDQVAAIYIRTVTNKKKMAALKTIVEATTHVELIVIEHSQQAIDHAQQNGFIEGIAQSA